MKLRTLIQCLAATALISSTAWGQPAPQPTPQPAPQPTPQPTPAPPETTPPPPSDATTPPPTTPPTPVTSPTPPTAPAPTPVVEPTPTPEPEPPATKLEWGGFLMGLMYYDSNGNISRPWLNKVNGDGDSAFDADPLPTRLTLTGTTKKGEMQGKGYLEVDLKTGVLGRIRQAYASVGSTKGGTLLVGQTFTLVGGFNLIDSYNIDAFFNQGATYTRQPQVRYTYKSGKVQLYIAAATYRGAGSVTVAKGAVGTATVVELPKIPNAQARVEYAIGEKGFVGVAGTVGQFEVTFTPTPNMMSPLMGFTKKATSVMAVVDALIPFGKHKFLAHAFWSRSGGNSSAAAQMIAVQADGELQQVDAYGGYVDLILTLAPGLRLSTFATVDNPKDHAGSVQLPIERNLDVGALLAKELMPKVEGGIQVEYAETKTPADRFHDVRTTVGIKYSL